MKKNYRILITWKPAFFELRKYNKHFKKHNIKIDKFFSKQFLKENQLIGVIHKYDAVICGDDEFSKNVLKKAVKLKVISKWGTGLDSIDLHFCRKLKIKVFNSPGAFTNSVAQLAVGMLLCISRDILNTHLDIKNNTWPKRAGFLINSKTIGIIGFGNIGKKISEMLTGFRCKVIYHDIKKKIRNIHKVKRVTKDNLLKSSDVIFLCTDLNKSSENLIDFNEIRVMKKNVCLINISRGKIINQKALVYGLKKKIIKAVGLDVFEEEPIKNDNPLLKFNNCILSSHNAFNTSEEVSKVHKNTFYNLFKGLNIIL
jgi:D-3-phosphoglycerate dehydrogenase